MGWWEDIAHPIGNAIAEGVNTVGSLVSAPLEGARDILNGRNIAEVFEEKGKKVLGASVNLASGGWIVATEPGQTLLRDKNLSALTLGATENFAGYSNVGRLLQTGDEIQQSEWNLAGRFLAQAGAVTAAAATGYLGSSELGTSQFTLQNWGIAQAASPMLARGDLKGLAGLAGIAAPIAGLLPSNPAAPPPRAQPSSTQAPSSPEVITQWSNSGGVGNFMGMSEETLLLTAVAVVGAALIARRM